MALLTETIHFVTPVTLDTICVAVKKVSDPYIEVYADVKEKTVVFGQEGRNVWTHYRVIPAPNVLWFKEGVLYNQIVVQDTTWKGEFSYYMEPDRIVPTFQAYVEKLAEALGNNAIYVRSRVC